MKINTMRLSKILIIIALLLGLVGSVCLIKSKIFLTDKEIHSTAATKYGSNSDLAKTLSIERTRARYGLTFIFLAFIINLLAALIKDTEFDVQFPSASKSRKQSNMQSDKNYKMPTLEGAITLATEAHKGQQDKNDAPYILHPLRVMARRESETDKIVAVLHDVIEDTPITMQVLNEKGFSKDIINAVDCLTRRKDEPYDQFIERCKSNPIALRVKIADLEDNMDIRRYNELKDEDLNRLNKYLKAWRYLTKAA